MPATLFHKVTESFSGALFVGHSEGDLLFLEQVGVQASTPAHHIDSMVHLLIDMKELSGNTVAAPSHIVRFAQQVGIVTPYVESIPLRLVQVAARAKSHNCPVGVALRIAIDIVDGLCEYYSLQSALSGGVCPDQILVGSNGETRVGNVAIAAMPFQDSPWHANSQRLAYLAPEQVSATGSYDSRTDVYSVAVMLWELIANRPRLSASATRILETLKAANGVAQLAPLDAKRVAPGLLEVLGRALHPQPSERYSSMGSFACALLESGEEPASGAEVAKFVELVAEKHLQPLRAAIRSQGSLLNEEPPSGHQAKAPVLRSEPPPTQKGAQQSVRPPSIGPADLPSGNSDHTAVFQVPAELLERARRGISHSDAPPAHDVNRAEQDKSIKDESEQRWVSDQLLDESNCTVVFKVPEALLQEARRMFESTDAVPPATDTKAKAVVEPPGDLAPVAPRELLLGNLHRGAVPQLQDANQEPVTDEDVATRIWKPRLSHRSSDEQTPTLQTHRPRAPSPEAPPEEPNNAAQSKPVWLWELIICLALAGVLIMLVLIRLRQG